MGILVRRGTRSRGGGNKFGFEKGSWLEIGSLESGLKQGGKN